MFTATVIAMGEKSAVDKTEQEVLLGMSYGEEKENQPPPKKPKERSTPAGKENFTKTPKRRRKMTRKPLTQVQKNNAKKEDNFTFELGLPTKGTDPPTA